MKRIYLTVIILICLAGQTMKAQSPQLWGLTENCGIHNCGSIIKINEDGSGFETMYSFDTLTGMNPYGSLLKGTDGKLYGLTTFGGSDTNHYLGMMGQPGAGVIFSFDPVYNVYTDLYNFDFVHGAFPYGSLIQLSNGKLYGIASWGGIDSNGALFSFEITTSIYTDLYDFNNIIYGASPSGSLTQASNGKLYGLAAGGDTSTNQNGLGTIFSFDTSNNTYTDLYNFELLTGVGPIGNLIQATDGKLYGATNAGGDTLGNSNGRGVIFSFDPLTNIYHDLCNDSSIIVQSPLIQATNGKLYGTNFGGDVISFDLSTDTLSIRFNFSTLLFCSLVQGSNGKLYGADDYHIFALDTTGTNFTSLNNFNPTCTNYGAFIELPANTGIKEISITNSISLSQNPFTTQTTLTLQGSNHNPSLFIYNLLGQEVRSIPVGTNTQVMINREHLSSGMYFYKLIDENKEVLGIGKILVE